MVRRGLHETFAMTASPAPEPRSFRVIAAGYIGNVLEWYDFAVYGFFAATIGNLFFPSEDAAASLIAAFGAFAAGFLARPVGSILFGHIGDRLGRRRMLIVSSLAMALATFAVGLLPTHAAIGPAAAVLMVALRLVQGLSVGGEYVGSAMFLAERAPRGLRGLFASISMSGVMSGLLLGSAVGALVTALLTEAEITAWGWRLPFLAGLALGAVALGLRWLVREPPLPAERARVPLFEAVAQHGRAMLHVVTLYALTAGVWYITLIYMPVWLVRHRGFEHGTVLDLSSVYLALSVVLGLGAAYAGDRFGRRRIVLTIVGAVTVLTYPLFWVIGHGGPDAIAVALGVMVLLPACSAFVLPGVLAEMFPWRVRATAANLSLNVAFALVGGTGPMIAALLVDDAGGLSGVAIYLTALGIVSCVACTLIKDRRAMELD